MNKLFALGGKLRAGKDATADYLEWEYGFQKLGMSDPLNEALLALNPLIPTDDEEIRFQDSQGNTIGALFDYVPYRELHDEVGYVGAKKNPEVRRLLQTLGTEVGRDMIDPDVWVRIAERRIRALWAEGKSVVITAIRFPNELDMVKRLGGVTVWIERPDELRDTVSPSKSLESEEATLTPEKGLEGGREAHRGLQSHSSETSVSAEDFETVISNDGTLEELYRKIDSTLEEDSPYMKLDWIEQIAPPYDR